MHVLNSLYGQPAFVEQFNNKARATVISTLDSEQLKGFKAAAAAATTPKTPGGGEKVKDAKDAKARAEKEAKLLVIHRAHEEALVNQELFQSSCNEAPIDSPAMKALAVKATKSTTWKKSTSMKDYKRVTIRLAASNYHPLSLLFKFFLETYGILAWWLHEFRTKYYLHHWDLQADKTLRGSSDVEPSTIVAAGSISPLDSPLSNISGSMARSQIDHLVREVLGCIFKKEPFSANLVDNPADQKPAAKSKSRAASNPSIRAPRLYKSLF